ncbi:hypothetical protein SFC50_22350 [Bacillus infantis]|uniref:hypothetical protein n=1 Tax=Bacillus infantis TaxID=324767 RepID=UPI0039829231
MMTAFFYPLINDIRIGFPITWKITCSQRPAEKGNTPAGGELEESKSLSQDNRGAKNENQTNTR